MPVLQGLGMNYNYNGSGASPSVDIPLIAALDFRTIRLFLWMYSSSSQQSDWRAILATALAQPQFTKIIYGVSIGSGTLTSSTWSPYSSAVQAEAAYVAALSDSRIEFQIGNELELHHDGTITDAQLRTNIRSLAASIHTSYPSLALSYSSSITIGTEISNWSSEGIGTMSRIGFNCYDTRSKFFNDLTAIHAAFPSTGFVSEWGTNNGYSDFNDENEYKAEMQARLTLLTNSGIAEFDMYNFMNADDTTWGAKLSASSDCRHVWGLLIGSNGIGR